ncbi:MAG TPA: restriction endonuclease [Aggregatilineales bacterium]|nr:restriction endonuclease [Aggregatilineales bacterium]
MGLVFGIGGQICLLISPQKTDLEGMLIRMPIQTVNLLLLLSFCLLTLGFLIRRAAKKQPGFIEPAPRRRASARKNLASGNEFNRADLQQYSNTPDPRQRKKAVTIPEEDIEQEVAWVFNTLYPVKARVDNPPKGKINIKLFDEQGKMLGVVQVSRDPEDTFLPPTALSSLNSYKSKANVAKAFFVTTGMFRDDTSAQAKEMGISLVDGPLLDAWRKRARAKSGVNGSR